MTKRAEEELMAAATREMATSRDFALPVHLDIQTLMCLVGALQLALRHPGNTGPSSQVVRQVIDAIIDRLEVHGYRAVAHLMRLGYNPEHDI